MKIKYTEHTIYGFLLYFLKTLIISKEKFILFVRGYVFGEFWVRESGS